MFLAVYSRKIQAHTLCIVLVTSIMSVFSAFFQNFLGPAPAWYKQVIIAFLILNPIIYFTLGATVAGWLLILEFIFTLAMALKCYPLQPGGLLAIEAVLIGLTNPELVYHEIENNLKVVLLLVFMVAGVYFMKDLLFFAFNRLLLKITNKRILALLFCFAAAILSAFLDALTVIAVIISVAAGLYGVYHSFVSAHPEVYSKEPVAQEGMLDREDLEKFRSFLRSIMMHAAVGTALGGVCTLVGEPQNLVIAEKGGWGFIEFVIRMSPITIPVFFSGLFVCYLLEKFKIFGYGEDLPEDVRNVLQAHADEEDKKRTINDKVKLFSQGIVAIWLVVALALHLAEVGIIGLSVIVLASSFIGVIEEHQIGKAFEEALPFTALLVVFFVVVSVIEANHLFTPVIDYVLSLPTDNQAPVFYLANGLLSAISDNVFVATVYINEVAAGYANGLITRDQFDVLAVAINTGTNLPSVATPNGQAAFLFLLTSAIAPLIRLSYGRMVWMALPYTIVLTIIGFICIFFFLEPVTDYFYDIGIIEHHTGLGGEESAHH